RRQLGYSFDKVNSWLLERNLPVIERTRQGHFIIDKTVFTKVNREQGELPADDVLTEEQRIPIIIMMLLSMDYLSLVHFTSELDVSKNTVLTDLKHTQHVVEDYGLNIHYSRRSGYVIDGNEFEIRKLLFHVTDRI